MTRKLAPLLAFLAFALVGCSATSAPVAEAVTETPTPTPTIEASTPEQVASVVAEYEADWREVIDGSSDCRLTWVLDQGTLQGQVEGMTCYLREQTMNSTAQLVIRDWGELTIPSSMVTLVSETEAVLQAIADKDIKTACGDGDIPAETEACTSTLGSLNMLYRSLEGQLNKWKPYL